MCCMACVLDGKGQMPVALKICPKYWVSLEKKLHLLIFMGSLADLSFFEYLPDMWEVFLRSFTKYYYII